MKKWLSYLVSTDISRRNIDTALLLFRVTIALSMMHTHGLKKVLDFEAAVAHIPDPFGIGGEASVLIAIFANIVCTLLVIIGLATRLSALCILAVTLVGLFVVHANDPWTVKDIPLMYSTCFAFIAYVGAGRYAIDHLISASALTPQN